MVGIEDLRDATDVPARLGLPPDRLPECQRRLNSGGGGEEEQIARDGPAVIIEDDGQPGLPWLARAIRHEDVELGVVGLPDGIGPFGLGAMDEVEGFAIGLRTVVGQRHERGFQPTNHPVDGPVRRDRFAEPSCDEGRLAVHGRR